MADREQTLRRFTKRRRAINLHKELRQDPKYRSVIEKSIKERKRSLEEWEAEQEIEDYAEEEYYRK
jgi:hypothetical protein